MVTSMNNTGRCYFYVFIGVVLFDWGNCFPYFLNSIYIVLDIVCSTMNNNQIRFFSNSGSNVINEVICGYSRMTFHFHWIITRKFSPIYILDHGIAYDKSLIHYHWAICRLSFNQVTIIAVFVYWCFIVLFIRGGSFIDLNISDSINSMIIRVIISYVSVYTTSLDWVSWITRQDWLLSKFELCSSKGSINICLLTTPFFKNLFSTSCVLRFCFSAYIFSFSLDSFC